MPDLITTILALDGLGWLIAGTFIAGVVRGFTGFGTALVYLPIAGAFLPPVWALTTLVMMDVLGPLPNLPTAWREGRPRDVGLLWLGAAVALPFGLMVLYAVDPNVFRYAVCVAALGVPMLLASGLRYTGEPRGKLLLGTGLLSGFLGGVAGVPGPPVILLYLASSGPARAIRANIMMYLVAFDVTLLALFAAQGRLEWVPVLLGVGLAVPNLLGNLAGAAMFRPDSQTIYRVVGYSVTMASAVIGLPLWD
ncbi:MAG: sulfite exporter TauE/SafE family protein [Thalassovita sp.]